MFSVRHSNSVVLNKQFSKERIFLKKIGTKFKEINKLHTHTPPAYLISTLVLQNILPEKL